MESEPEMLTRRAALLAASVWLAFGSAALADAPAAQKFTQAAFEDALKQGKPVLVHVTAPWCPICQAQGPALEKIRAQDRFKDLLAFDIPFDDDKPSVRLVGARLQSTIIVYKQGREVARSVGDAQYEWIEDLVEKAL